MYGDQFNLSFFSIAKSLCNVTDSSLAVGAPSPFSSDSFMSTASTLDTYEMVGNEFVSAYGIMSMLNSEMMNCCSSDPASYASQTSPGRYESPQPSLMSSIQNNCFDRRSLPSFCGLVQSERICRDGETQMMKQERSKNEWESESRMIIKGMGKACRYSVEEKKERIERYRSKRNQRNFSKKIKYECRKTLADSRIRVKGRFARNEEIEKTSSEQWSPAAIGVGDDENDVGYDHNWINFLNNIPPRIQFHEN